jgi:hypothetical protein
MVGTEAVGLGVAVHQRTVHGDRVIITEQRRKHERMRSARRLEDATAFLGDPVVREVEPAALITYACTATEWR